VEVLGKHFSDHNNEVESIDYQSYTPGGNRLKVLWEYVKKSLDGEDCPEDSTTYFYTNGKASVYLDKYTSNELGEDFFSSDNDTLKKGVCLRLNDLTKIANGYMITCDPGDSGDSGAATKESLGKFADLVTSRLDCRSIIINNQSDLSEKEPAQYVTDQDAPMETIEELDLEKAGISQEIKLDEKEKLNLSLYTIGLKNSTQKSNNDVYLLRLHGWPDGGAPTEMKGIYSLVMELLKFTKKNKIKNKVYHCNAGQGRSASMLIYTWMTEIAMRAEEKNIKLCFCNDNLSQTHSVVNGELNIAFVLRNILLNGMGKRSIFGWGPKQFDSYVEYAKYLVDKINSQYK
jgi:hypothetical protein